MARSSVSHPGPDAPTSASRPTAAAPDECTAGLRGLDQPVRLDIICRHDLVDVEVGGRYTLINRFWNPQGDRFGVWVTDGSLAVRDLVIRPLSPMTTAGTGPADER